MCPIVKLSAIAGPDIITHDGNELASADAKTRYLNSANFIEFEKRSSDDYTVMKYNDPTSPDAGVFVLLEDADDILASANA